MQVFITRPARTALKDICDYYREKGFHLYSDRLRISIIQKAKSLSKHHQRGQEEELLRPLKKGHRYLLAEKHYKIIYRIVDNQVIVTDVFDTRQLPDKLADRNEG